MSDPNPNNYSIALFCCHLDYNLLQSLQIQPSLRRASSAGNLMPTGSHNGHNVYMHNQDRKLPNDSVISRQRRSLRNYGKNQYGYEYSNGYQEQDSCSSSFSRQHTQQNIKLYGDFSQFESVIDERLPNNKKQNPNQKTVINTLNSLTRMKKRSNQMQKQKSTKRNQARNKQRIDVNNKIRNEYKQNRPTVSPFQSPNQSQYIEFTLNQLNCHERSKQNQGFSNFTTQSNSHFNSYDNSSYKYNQTGNSNQPAFKEINVNTKSSYYYPTELQRKIYNQANKSKAFENQNFYQNIDKERSRVRGQKRQKNQMNTAVSPSSKAFQQLQNKIIECNKKYTGPVTPYIPAGSGLKKYSNFRRQVNLTDVNKNDPMTKKEMLQYSYHSSYQNSFFNPQMKFQTS